jgi:hypothetical protein
MSLSSGIKGKSDTLRCLIWEWAGCSDQMRRLGGKEPPDVYISQLGGWSGEIKRHGKDADTVKVTLASLGRLGRFRLRGLV